MDIGLIVLVLILLFSTCFRNKFMLFLSVVSFISIVSLRPVAIPDTLPYLNFYEAVELADLWSNRFYFEKGFVFLTCILKLFSSNSVYYFASLVCVNLALLIMSFNNLNKEFSLKTPLVLGLIAYIPYYGLFYNAIVLRAGIALSLGLLALTLKNKWSSLFFILLAFTFHKSSIILLLSYFIFNYFRKLSQKKYYFIAFSILFLYLSGIHYFLINNIVPDIISISQKLSVTSFANFKYYLSYFNDLKYSISYKLLYYILSLLIFIYILPYVKSKIYFRYLNVFIVGLIISILFSTFEQITRLTDFLLISHVCLLFYISGDLKRPKVSLFVNIYLV